MRVTSVERGGRAELAGVVRGDELVSVGGRKLTDSLDLTFALGWLEDPEAEYEFLRKDVRLSVVMPVARPEELGFEVEEPPTRTCGNACVFCFVDQLPRGLRSSLYIKDEDYRLSFSFGNYITLTNLSDADFDRIADLRLSPLYVSVHATDDAVRRKMLDVDDAPAILDAIGRLAAAGVRVHAQAVIVPGLNDGDVLERTLADLHGLGETIESVAVVPVGLTAHRDGLPEIEPVTRDSAATVLDAVGRWQQKYREDGRSRTVYAADEFYLLAGRALPSHDEYEDLPQLENGVGLLSEFAHELSERATELGDALNRPLSVTLVTGELAAASLRETLARVLGEVNGLTLEVVAAPNTLFGPSVTVAGLMSGEDMAGALKAAPDSDLFLLPAAAFNIDDLTLDGLTAGEVAEQAGRDGVVVTDDVVGAIAEADGR